MEYSEANVAVNLLVFELYNNYYLWSKKFGIEV